MNEYSGLPEDELARLEGLYAAAYDGSHHEEPDWWCGTDDRNRLYQEAASALPTLIAALRESQKYWANAQAVSAMSTLKAKAEEERNRSRAQLATAEEILASLRCPHCILEGDSHALAALGDQP